MTGSSFGGRRAGAGRAFAGVVGIFLLPGALAPLLLNEGYAVDRERSLLEGAGLVLEAPADRVDPTLEGKLVHVAGALRVPGTLADPDFPTLSIPSGAVLLRRAVKTFQWEEVANRGGSYSYRQVWSDKAPESASFHQPAPRNPPSRYRAQQWVAPAGWLGPYKLTEPLLQRLGPGQPVPPKSDRPDLLVGKALYVGENPSVPIIGDQQLTWEATAPAAASIVAQQRGLGFVPYEAKAGASIDLISAGILSAKEMVGEAERASSFATWMGRVFGTGLLFLSLYLLLRSLPEPPADRAQPLLTRAANAAPAQTGAVLTVILAPLVIMVSWMAAHLH